MVVPSARAINVESVFNLDFEIMLHTTSIFVTQKY